MPKSSSDSNDPQAIFGRSIDMLGEEGFHRMKEAFVIVIGLGGVGSHAAMALARSGLGRIRLVDIDPVSATSLNRHAVATLADIGKPKVEVIRNALLAVCPDIDVDIRQKFYHRDTEAELLEGKPDIVVDAIDSLNPKVALLRACVEKGIPVVTSMGASARTDPTKIRVDDIGDTRICPLARVVRRRLRRQGVNSGIETVYSIEPSRSSLEPDESEEFYRRGRQRRRLPSLAMIPGIFGYSLAMLAVRRLTGLESD